MNDADIIIVGSGFAGSICADRLSKAGRRVVVLERGPWRDSLPVRSMGVADRAPFPYGRKAVTHLLRNLRFGPLNLRLNKRGLFELSGYSGISVLAASAVGGGSHAWGAMLTPPQDPDFWANRHPDLHAGVVEGHYETVRRDLGAERPSQDHWGENSIWSQFPASNGSRCQPADPQPYLAITLPRSAADVGREFEGPNGVRRAVSALDGDSFLGSRGGAKANVDYIYLAPAIARGALVRDLCEVRGVDIIPSDEGGGYCVRYRDLRNGALATVRAPRVILAAGAMNTLRLLFVSSQGRGGLIPMPSLGATFGANGDLFGFWLQPEGRPCSFKGPPVLGQFTVDGQTDPCLALATLPGLDTLPLPGFVKRLLARTAVFLGIGPDSGTGVVSFRGGRLRARYDFDNQPIFARLRAAFAVIKEDTGDKIWVNNVFPLTLHPWGGARIGPDADHGVINHQGEVYGNPGLFVVDGSALPAAPGTPPTMAISAWAHHVAGRLAERLA